MADFSASTWKEQDSANTASPPNGFPTGQAPNTLPGSWRNLAGASVRSYRRINPWYTTTGTATALVITMEQAPTAYSAKERLTFIANVANTGAMTLNINSLGAKSILRYDGTALVAGDIGTGLFTEVFYDGTAFRVINGAGGKYTGNITAGSFTTTGAISAASVTASGAISAATFSGNGAALTALNTTNIASGTIADARLPTTMTAKTFSGAVVAPTFSGNGAALTDLNASALTTGTLPNARLLGDYDFGALALAGRLTLNNGGEAIRLNATNATSDPYITFYKTIDGTDVRQAYIQHTDGTSTSQGLVLRNDSNNNFIAIMNTTGNDSLRYSNNGTNNEIWHSGNDGSGSTLDADLLDGQEGTYYRDLTNSTGTLPNARMAGDYSFANLGLSGNITVSGRVYAPIVEAKTPTGNPDLRLTRGSVRVGSFYDDGNLVLRKYNPDTGAGEGYFRIDGGGVNDGKYNGNTIWHAGNDGSGTGLDADLLDGQHGTYYRDLTNSTGTLPNARISGDYDGIGVLKLTNRLEVSGSAPNIRLLDTTSGQYSARLRVDANNAYFDSSTDDVNFGEVFRFELDTKKGYVNGSEIKTAATILNIGTSASSARSALGLGDLATQDWGGLVYGGTSMSNTSFPIGSMVLCVVTGWKNRNATVTVRNAGGDSNFHEEDGTTLTGTWRARGSFSAGDRYCIVQRVS